MRDRDGDPIDYLWGQNDGQPIVASNIRTLTRAAPAQPGLQSTYLIARDGRDGYAWKRIDVEIGPPEIQISGIAIDETTREALIGRLPRASPNPPQSMPCL